MLVFIYRGKKYHQRNFVLLMIPVLLTLSAILQRWFMPTISTSLTGLSRWAVARRARLQSCWNNPSPVMLIVSGSNEGSFLMYRCFNASMPNACWSLLLAWLRSQLNNSSLHWPSVARHDHNVSTWSILRLKESTNIVKEYKYYKRLRLNSHCLLHTIMHYSLHILQLLMCQCSIQVNR